MHSEGPALALGKAASYLECVCMKLKVTAAGAQSQTQP